MSTVSRTTRKTMARLSVRIASDGAHYTAEIVAVLGPSRFAGWNDAPAKTPLLAVKKALNTIADTANARGRGGLYRAARVLCDG